MKRVARFLTVSIATVCMVSMLALQVASADPLTSVSDTMSRLKASIASNHTIKFTTPTGVDASTDTITVTFAAAFTIGSVAFGDIDLSHGASTGYETEETLAGTAASGVWGAAFAGQVLTLTAPTNAAAGEITASDKVVVEIGTNASSGANQITNPGSAGTYTISIGGTFGDSGRLAVAILADEQVTVTATVDPSLSFSVSANSTAFGTFVVGSVTTASPNITLVVGTNSNSGYTVTVRDTGSASNPGLYKSASPTDIIGSADGSYSATADLSAATLGFGLQASSDGTATVAADFAHGSDTVGGLTLADKTLASYTTHPIANHTITVVHKAKASGFVRAGSYQDVMTYVATANF